MRTLIRFIAAFTGGVALSVPVRVALVGESPTVPAVGAMIILGIVSFALFAITCEQKGGAS